ncbi:PrsW family intramembrane metalloprotease [Actinoplanes sp. NPDC020271]|uniref:PrsW family intramembrane metalloprotease n=1 Tax=Actinoplanes sp. NPDC020271 TaxID=3363896 RepID=UPI0037A98061
MMVTLVVLAVLAAGAGRMGMIVVRFMRTYPAATVTALLLFLTLIAPVWFLIRALAYFDRRRPLVFMLAFAWGASVAPAVTIPASTALDSLIAKRIGPGFAAEWGAMIAGPSVEEIVKTLGILAVLLATRKSLTRALDGIVIGALVGLGFQICEDVVFAVGSVALQGDGDALTPVLTTFVVRGLLAGVTSHTIFSALAGAGLLHAIARHDRPIYYRIGVASAGVASAWISHVIWNSPISVLPEVPAGILLVLVVKMLVPLAALVFLVRRAHDQEATHYLAGLAALGDRSLITEAELSTLGSAARRARARRAAAAVAGRTGTQLMRALQQSQAALAVVVGRDGADYSHDLHRHVVQIRSLRLQLRGLGLGGEIPPFVILPAVSRDAACLPQRQAARLVELSIGIIPSEHRDRYGEEFYAELLSLAERRARPAAQLSYAANQFVSALMLRRELRVRDRR